MGLEPNARAGLIAVVVGMQVFIIQPGFLAGLAGPLGLTEAWIGYIASAEMAGIALTTIGAALLGRRLRPRATALGALLTLALADMGSILAITPPLFLTIRFIAGAAAGLLISIGYTELGRSQYPDRGFGYAIMAMLSYSALGLFLLPAAFQHIGVGGVLAALGLMALVAVPLAHSLPTDGHRREAAKVSHVTAASRWILVAILAFFLGQGVVWPFLSLIGSTHGISDQQVANGLAVSQLAGIFGAFAAARFGAPRNHLRLLVAGALGSAVPLVVLVWPVSGLGYAAAMFAFNGAANIATPLLMSMAAAIDGEGALVQRSAALQMIGLASGPLLATPFLAGGDFQAALWLSAGLFALAFAAGTRTLSPRSAPT